MFFRRRERNGGTAVAEPQSRSVAGEFSGSDEELRAEIAELTAANRASRDRDREVRLLTLRHIAGIRQIDSPPAGAEHPQPDDSALPDPGVGLPDVAPADLTPELLRAGILRDGSVLVRGLIDREEAVAFADGIERAFAARDLHDTGARHDPDHYTEFVPDARSTWPMSRPWIKEGGGVLAVDSPRLCFAMLDMFERAGMLGLVHAYLGEPASISAQKATLRKAMPEVGGAWHQDGAFMGEVRALNIWVSLSRCGDLAPGLDIVPRRLDNLVESGTEGTFLDYQVSQRNAEEAAGDRPIVRPIFEPGDVLFFDELCLHQTGSDPSMPNPRYAIESWFFGGSSFPGDYAPLAAMPS